jgi:hypothetical protein
MQKAMALKRPISLTKPVAFLRNIFSDANYSTQMFSSLTYSIKDHPIFNKYLSAKYLDSTVPKMDMIHAKKAKEMMHCRSRAVSVLRAY